MTLIPLQELEARQSETARTLAGLRGQAEALGSRAGDRLEEAGRLLLQRRNEWKSEVLDAAVLDANGRTTIETPLILKRDEQAYFSTPARLARQKTRTRIVGGSQGFSFPIGHTGIRYRIGSFRGEPVRQEYLMNLNLLLEHR